MNKLFILLALVSCFMLHKVVLGQDVFKPQTLTTGPYGGPEGQPFEFVDFTFFQYESTLTVSACNRISSLQSSFLNELVFEVTEEHPEGGHPSFTSPLVGKIRGQVSEWKREGEEYIVKASVCTGNVEGKTVVTGLSFVTDKGKTTSFGAYGKENSVCLDATPATEGYRLAYLSGLANNVIDQLTFHWQSDFSQEWTCLTDSNCKEVFDFCYFEGNKSCCLTKEEGATEGTVGCVA